MAGETYVFTVRAVVSRWVLEKIPRDCPSWYYTNLQIAALERSVEKFKKRFWVSKAASVLGGKISKKRRKAMGDALRRLNQQAKKLRALLSKTLEESFQKQYPRVPARAIRRKLAGANKQFEKTISEIVKEDRAKVLAAVAQPKGLKS